MPHGCIWRILRENSTSEAPHTVMYAPFPQYYFRATCAQIHPFTKKKAYPLNGYRKTVTLGTSYNLLKAGH